MPKLLVTYGNKLGPLQRLPGAGGGGRGGEKGTQQKQGRNVS